MRGPNRTELLVVYECVVEGRVVSRDFRRKDARRFAGTFNRVMDGLKKCRIRRRVFTAEDDPQVSPQSHGVHARASQCKSPSFPSLRGRAIAGKPALRAVRKPR